MTRGDLRISICDCRFGIGYLGFGIFFFAVILEEAIIAVSSSGVIFNRKLEIDNRCSAELAEVKSPYHLNNLLMYFLVCGHYGQFFAVVVVQVYWEDISTGSVGYQCAGGFDY